MWIGKVCLELFHQLRFINSYCCTPKGDHGDGGRLRFERLPGKVGPSPYSALATCAPANAPHACVPPPVDPTTFTPDADLTEFSIELVFTINESVDPDEVQWTQEEMDEFRVAADRFVVRSIFCIAALSVQHTESGGTYVAVCVG